MTFIIDNNGMAFTQNPLDRMSDKREDADFVAKLKADTRSKVVVLARDMPVLEGHEILLELSSVADLGEVSQLALLGLWDQTPVFAVLLQDEASEVVDVADEGGLLDTRVIRLKKRSDLKLVDTRSIATGGLVSPNMLGILAQAKAVLHWHHTHQFCGRCGTKTYSSPGGSRRDCPNCAAQHFPRTDPVVIMLAVDGDRCLLGRQPRFPKGMYSCLAGFLENGETIGDAVRRELFEEAGIRTGEVQYVGSQPWPFPASLMIGAVAHATSTGLKIDHNELEDARWFSKDEASSVLTGTHPDGFTSPASMAIAHHILKTWLNSQS